MGPLGRAGGPGLKFCFVNLICPIVFVSMMVSACGFFLDLPPHSLSPQFPVSQDSQFHPGAWLTSSCTPACCSLSNDGSLCPLLASLPGLSSAGRGCHCGGRALWEAQTPMSSKRMPRARDK